MVFHARRPHLKLLNQEETITTALLTDSQQLLYAMRRNSLMGSMLVVRAGKGFLRFWAPGRCLLKPVIHTISTVNGIYPLNVSTFRVR